MSILRYLFILCCLLIITKIDAQNLVPNSGFEVLSGGLTGEGQINLATGWSAPGASTSTPDLFNASYIGPQTLPCDNVDVPNNTGGFAPAHIGNGYAGISNDFTNGYFEYITVKLTIALTPGEIYILDMYAMCADSARFANNKVSAVLSTSLLNQGGSGIIPFFAQYQNVDVVSDTGSWRHLLFTPYVASGGEQYITIGFFNSSVTKIDLGAKNSGCTSYDNSSYIYIDDVTLVPSFILYIPPADTAYVCPANYTTTIYPVATNVAVTWSTQNGSILPNNDGAITVPDSAVLASGANIPGAFFTYYILGNGQIDSVKLLVINAPNYDIGSDTTYCESDSVLLNAFLPNAISYEWSNGDTLSYTYVTDTGHYSVIVANPGCAVSDSIYFYKLLPNPPVNLGEDSLFCFYYFDSLRLDATTSNAVSYFWRPTGESSPKITVMYADFYAVSVTRENGCVRTGGFEVMEVCPPSYYAPNAFTPDGDGINDIYKIFSENYEGFTLRIYNRFGQQLFNTEDPDLGWDGTYKGKECELGVYTYKISINGYNFEGEKVDIKKAGTFVLYR